MTLVDTSVWVDHLRRGSPTLSGLLTGSQVLSHPFVIGELACGTIRNREQFLSDLQHLPRAEEASDAEAMYLIEQHTLHGMGIGWVDGHLIASARITGCRLWTLDARLRDAALKVGVKLSGNRE